MTDATTIRLALQSAERARDELIAQVNARFNPIIEVLENAIYEEPTQPTNVPQGRAARKKYYKNLRISKQSHDHRIPAKKSKAMKKAS
jgi:hypothetical protein